MSNFWSGLFGGANDTLKSAIPKYGQISGFATGLGQNLLSQAGGLDSALLSGDQAKISKLLAPQFSAIQGQKQQQLNQTAQFSNRSGGNNAFSQQAGDKARSSINDMISQLTSSALGGASSLGSSLLNTGISALGQQVDASQMQLSNWQNSLFGGAITGAAGIGLGAAGKAAGVGGMFGI